MSPHDKLKTIMEKLIMTKKFNIIQGCIDGLYTVPQAAEKLEISERQVQRLKKEVKYYFNE